MCGHALSASCEHRRNDDPYNHQEDCGRPVEKVEGKPVEMQ